jgi:hypothetical protein
MSSSDTPGKTPQEILDKLIWDIALDDEIGDGEKQINEALRQLHALIRGEVIGEDEPLDGDMIDPNSDNRLRDTQRDALNRLFGIEGEA